MAKAQVQRVAQQNDRRVTYTVLGVLAVWAVLFADVLIAIVNTWLGSNTYTHGFIIVPIAVYFAWKTYQNEPMAPIRPLLWPVLLLLINQLVFVLSDLMGIMVLKQFAAYFSLVFVLLALLGTALVRQYLFPIVYLVFAVPFGEEFVPQLQEITAQLSIYFLRLSDIPVYREGLYLYIPNGTFEVAEACSGVRFMIASLALGTLYAYMSYTSYWRRAAFIVISLLVPIVANGIRAYAIVLVGYLSDMEYATGVDHLVFGWVFFGIVMFLLFMIGSIWQESPQQSPQRLVAEAPVQGTVHATSLPVSAALVLLLLAPVFYQQILSSRAVDGSVYTNTAPYQTAVTAAEIGSWSPHFASAHAHYQGRIADGASDIEFYAAGYDFDNEQAELMNYNNQLFDIERWTLDRQQAIEIKGPEGIVRATLATIVSTADQRRYLLYWYQVGDTLSSRMLDIKLAQLSDKLRGGSGGGKFIALSVPTAPGAINQLSDWISSHQRNLISRHGAGE